MDEVLRNKKHTEEMIRYSTAFMLCNVLRISNQLTGGTVLKRFAKFKRINMSYYPKRLAAFDFDSTVCSDNSDTAVRSLLPPDVVQDYETRQQFSLSGWTTYMQGVFDLLYNRKISETAIINAVTDIPPVEGMDSLIRRLKKINFDIIIISDANSVFINKWLENQGLADCIEQVFTNPGEFNNGHLTIKMYHEQHSCPLSTINLCKGKILEEYLETQNHLGVEYEKIVYVGDGANDFCPMLRLSSKDLACCRNGYSCAAILKKVLKKELYKNKLYEMKAPVLVWDNGNDILKALIEFND
ncbi:hypothetical protein FQA39_LY11796 [Lamprigera yunnana]|nr:hypothetical protein FQA39_LY11796 [Lamprigera yunnana]